LLFNKRKTCSVQLDLRSECYTLQNIIIDRSAEFFKGNFAQKREDEIIIYDEKQIYSRQMKYELVVCIRKSSLLLRKGKQDCL
jgi:hypothetical protein